MIQLNPRYEAIFNPDNIELKAAIKWEESEACFDSPEREQARPNVNCDGIASLMNVEADFIKEVLDAGLYKQVVRITSDIRHRSQDYGVSSYINI